MTPDHLYDYLIIKQSAVRGHVMKLPKQCLFCWLSVENPVNRTHLPMEHLHGLCTLKCHFV
jgi:hypothetical protein